MMYSKKSEKSMFLLLIVFLYAFHLIDNCNCYVSNNDVSKWKCGTPSIFDALSTTSAQQQLQWTFQTEGCLSNSILSLNISKFEVVLTPLFSPSAGMSDSCRNKFYPSISLTLTDRSRDVKIYNADSAIGLISISLPPSILTSARRPYEAKVTIGKTSCSERPLQFSILAQFAAASSSLTEGSIGPLMQRGNVGLHQERLFKFYPSMASQINNDKRDILIALNSLADADLFVNPPCSSGDCFYRRSRASSASPDPPALWVSQKPGGTEYLAISHSQLKPLLAQPQNATSSAEGFALYISVYGYASADFTLSLSSSTTLHDWSDVGYVKVRFPPPLILLLMTLISPASELRVCGQLSLL